MENSELLFWLKHPVLEAECDKTSLPYLLLSQEEGGPSGPDRLFKIVLVGNSSVGKTSLLRRFCDDCFQPGTSATVGRLCTTSRHFLCEEEDRAVLVVHLMLSV